MNEIIYLKPIEELYCYGGFQIYIMIAGSFLLGWILNDVLTQKSEVGV